MKRLGAIVLVMMAAIGACGSNNEKIHGTTLDWIHDQCGIAGKYITLEPSVNSQDRLGNTIVYQDFESSDPARPGSGYVEDTNVSCPH